MRTILLFALALLAVGCSPRNAIEQGEVEANECPDSPWPAVPSAYTDYEATGAEEGQGIGTWTLPDQFGCATDMRQFLGSVSVLDISSVWCGPCNEAAATSMEVFEAIREEHKASFFLTLLVQDELAGPAGVDDAAEWAEKYDLAYPVVVDDRESVRQDYGVIAFPVFLFIAPTGEVYERFEGKPEDSEILELLEFGLEEWAGDLRPEDEIPDPSLAELSE